MTDTPATIVDHEMIGQGLHNESFSISPDDDADSQEDSQDIPATQIQKRRRVTRACDECRRKKIKVWLKLFSSLLANLLTLPAVRRQAAVHPLHCL